MNAICEVYILSKTEQFYGTKGSSFTFLSWLLSKHNILVNLINFNKFIFFYFYIKLLYI